LSIFAGITMRISASFVTSIANRVMSLAMFTVSSLVTDFTVFCRLQCRRRGRRRRACRHGDCASVVCCYRGCRTGRLRRRPVTTRPTSCGAFILDASSGPSQCVTRPASPRPCLLVPVHIDRHSTPPQIQMTFGCLNIRFTRE